jgi:hypothetical protein
MINPARIVCLALILTGSVAYSQTQSTPPPQPTQPRTAGGDVGSGAGDIGKGTAGAAGNVAKGTGKGAADLVTLHPIDAAGNVGKGVGVGAKDAGVGVAKGTGKIAKGTGKGIGHLFHHSPKQPSSETSSSSY